MTELAHPINKQADLYDRLIERLGLALDMAKTSVRLRNEHPVELELRGLSHAEFQIIEAYLDRSDASENVVAMDSPGTRKRNSSGVRESSEPVRASHSSPNVIWLRDQRRAEVSAKLSRYSSSKHFKQ
ncbi:hypothetical protein [Pseudomonas sp. LP_7_YM]|uniref:hypothetical protein n=1 Tax=Pseudomonas sp. LP_7_YM TaxID=2485137 RepID=UPI00105FF808|nr:hypothetical protein [Pseudomonas sp. LP_7_YM]TDV61855.1 hypothetical protein EC915_10878 [Pseudomonas sp. LP_7_YM]